MQVLETGRLTQGLGLTFSPDGRWLALGGSSTRLIFLSSLSGERREVLLPDQSWAGLGLAFTTAGLALRNIDGDILVYDPEGNAPRHRIEGVRAIGVVTPPDGRTLFAARNPDYPEIARWDVGGFRELPPFGKHRGRVWHLAVSADGQRVAAGGSGHLRVWTLAGPTVPKRATYHIRMHGSGWVKCLALSHDGGVLATAARNQVIAWDVAFGVEKLQHSRHRRAVNVVAMSPIGPRLVSGGNDELVFVYDTETGRERHRYEWGIGAIQGLAFAPDGLRCAALRDSGRVVVWDTDD
jgi:WD40 repeat protein